MLGNPVYQSDPDYRYQNGDFVCNVQVVFPPAVIAIQVVQAHSTIQEDLVVTAETSNMNSALQLRLTNPRNYERMFISTVDAKIYHELKKEQSLHVAFSEFVENVRKILTQCQRKEMKINLVQSDGDNYVLKFVEVRSFRNLTHLILPTKTASETNIIFHMKKNMFQLEKQYEEQKNAMQRATHQLAQKDMFLDQLRKELNSTKSHYEEQIRHCNSRGTEEINMLRSSIEKLTAEKQQDKRNFDLKLTELHGIINQLRKDNAVTTEEKIHALKENEALREEIGISKSNFASLKLQNDKLVAEMQNKRALEVDSEAQKKHLRKQISALQKSLKEQEKANSNVLAELEAEKKVCNSKRNALQLAAEQIAKADEVISKQASEIEKLKENVDWRTDIALQQELIVREKEDLISLQNKHMEKLKSKFKGLGGNLENYESMLQELQNVVDSVSTKYSQRIKQLVKNLDPSEAFTSKRI